MFLLKHGNKNKHCWAGYKNTLGNTLKNEGKLM
jgi:hypothetical protein